MSIGISDDTALQMLEDRLELALNWWGNPNDKDLYMHMYERAVECGCFDGVEDFNPMVIVDNDIVNYTKVITKEDEDFETYYKLAKQGECDISCEDLAWNFIEEYDDERILVRY